MLVDWQYPELLAILPDPIFIVAEVVLLNGKLIDIVAVIFAVVACKVTPM